MPIYATFYRSKWRQNDTLPLLDFSANWIKRWSNLFDGRAAQAPGSFMLVDPLKTSSLDSLTAYIKPQLQINVTFLWDKIL